MKPKLSLKIRTIHKYLGLIIGIQFLFWTISGLYFSWTDIDEIHGDHFRKTDITKRAFTNLIDINKLNEEISSIQLIDIVGEPYYWVNSSKLFNAKTGEISSGISEKQALLVAEENMLEGLSVNSISLINSVPNGHEYRGNPLPAYVVDYNHKKNLKVYINSSNGVLDKVRYDDWRVFDFLWASHIMDYNTRDDINNFLLRVFSIFGLLTVLSGFALWLTTLKRLKSIF